MSRLPESIERETGARPDAAVVWLHGLGADGHDFEPLVPVLGLPARLAVRFVFPHAPLRPVTINMGMRMRAWYDIVSLGGGQEDEAGIRDSQSLLEALIERERSRGIEARRIVLAGFSQGGAIALQTGLRHHERLAGVMALSTWLPLAGTLEAERHAMNHDVPIFFAHGTHDEMIGLARAQQSRARLEALGYAPEWHEYPMGHAVCPEEIAAIAHWLGRVL
ncbi:MAG: carboxylesterase [Betaproteobacteria bacterium RIFCSPLOWO2_02_FULL_66_14]|nr:MAG: carboxylesterase [Betaproteobacteria bacterium RIFCSPLOWO2_02_FULL_66_14]